MAKDKINGSEQKKQIKKDYAKEALILKQQIIEEIEKIDVGVDDFGQRKENINKIYKIRAGVRAATVSKGRDVDFTISSSDSIKKLIETSNKLAGIMDFYANELSYVFQKGNTEKATEIIKGQATIQSFIGDAVTTLETLAKEYLRKNIGNKYDVKNQLEDDEAENNAKARDMYKAGTLPSTIANELGLSVDKVKALTESFKQEFLEAKKAEVKKKVLKKEDLALISEELEIKLHFLLQTLKTWALDDDKLALALKENEEARKQKKVSSPEDVIPEKVIE